MDNLEKLHINEIADTTSYRAAIVEDNSEIRTYLKDTLSKSFSLIHEKVEFDIYPSGDSFLETLNDHYHFDIIFMDIEMPGTDGIEVCRQAKRLFPDVLIVFISAKEELVFQTFEVQPFRFIRKSQYLNQLPSLTKSCAEYLAHQKRKIISFRETYSGDLYSFPVDSIKYIEALGKSCRIVTDADTVIIKNKLMSFEELLKDYSFLKPHRSYLVNCRYICYIGKHSLKLTDSEEIPISRNKSEEIKQQFMHLTIKG